MRDVLVRERELSDDLPEGWPTVLDDETRMDVAPISTWVEDRLRLTPAMLHVRRMTLRNALEHGGTSRTLTGVESGVSRADAR
ncbi:hypothetical protein MVI01_58640 [Myxococcus virescens]|uniref:Uncharacterized protein n=1 Tax=Myxococcus virescens TaxID=83456 RepID=A0A511HKI7_9BACT|nr:hypothetical protein MVI01_58640 [Myxococcus virescens]